MKLGYRWLGWGFTGLVIINLLIRTVVWINSLTAVPGLYDGLREIGFPAVISLTFAVVSALIIYQQPGNRVGWLMMIIALAMTNPVSIYTTFLLQQPATITPAIWFLLWADNWSWIPFIFPVFLIPLNFPTGKPPSRRWNWVNILAVGLWLAFIFMIIFIDQIGPLEEDWQVPNPTGFISEEKFSELFIRYWGMALIVAVIASVVSLFVRFRQAHGKERRQIKWLLYGGAIFAGNYVVTFYLTDEDRVQIGIEILFMFSVLAIPIAIAIAILRNQLYDIDIIIRRTLVYGILTTMLGVVYFGTVVVLQTVVGRATDEQSPLVIVFSTLLIAALFNPLRRRIQAFIDRRFYRRKYDAGLILAQFANVARDEVDVERLSAVLLNVVEETIQPNEVTLWLK